MHTITERDYMTDDCEFISTDLPCRTPIRVKTACTVLDITTQKCGSENSIQSILTSIYTPTSTSTGL
jgi:hypothetical protein